MFVYNVAEPVSSVSCNEHGFHAQRPKQLILLGMIAHRPKFKARKNLENCLAFVGLTRFNFLVGNPAYWY